MKRIHLNAFTQCAAGLQSFGQYRNPRDRTSQGYTDVRDAMKLAGLAPLIVGNPQQVTDEMERWVDEGEIDGFNLVPIFQPGGHADFVDLVVPELQRRGRVRTEYEGTTLREHFFGQGRCRLTPDHVGSSYAPKKEIR